MNTISNNKLSCTIIDMSPRQELFNITQTHSSLDECINDARNSSEEMFSITSLICGHGKPMKKKRKTCDLKPIVYVRFNTSLGKPKPVTLRALLDSGGSGSLVTSKQAKKLCLMKSKSNQTVWMTPGGALQTSTCCKAQFTIPELHDN